MRKGIKKLGKILALGSVTMRIFQAVIKVGICQYLVDYLTSRRHEYSAVERMIRNVKKQVN